MPYGISNTTIAVGLFAALIGGGLVGLYFRRVKLRVAEDVKELEEQAQENLTEEAAGYGVDMAPPDVGRTPLDIFRARRHLAVQARMAKKGYVKWFRVGARLHAPTWVKPEHKDTGQPEYEHDDTTYVFPKEALVTDGRTSAFVAIHKEGEPEPIDLRNPGWATLDPGALQKLFEMAINRDPPGGLGLPLTRQQLYYVGMATAAVGIWAVTQYTGVFG